MRRLLSIAVFSGAIAMLPNPVPADAAKTVDCVNEAISSCNSDFPANDPFTIGARGWCYMIRTAWCELFD